MKSRRISAKSQVFCDKCSGVITIEAASVKTKRFLDGIQFDYFILIPNQPIDKIRFLPVMLFIVSLDNEQIVSQSLSTTF